MSRNRKPKNAPGTVFRCPETGALVEIDKNGEEAPFEPAPWEPFPDPPKPDPFHHIPRRADGSIAPFYALDHQALEQLRQDTPRRVRQDGWTLERQQRFIERLAATASVTDAARFIGKSRQSARDLYNRSPQFRAAWDEALRAAVSVLVETAFDRAVNGVQEQVYHRGRMVGFREKYNDRLLMFLLRVRDPLNFAPLAELEAGQRHRVIEDRSRGIAPVLDRLEAAETAWAAVEAEPPALPHPCDLLAGAAEDAAYAPAAATKTPSHVTSSTSLQAPLKEAERPGRSTPAPAPLPARRRGF